MLKDIYSPLEIDDQWDQRAPVHEDKVEDVYKRQVPNSLVSSSGSSTFPLDLLIFLPSASFTEPHR